MHLLLKKSGDKQDVFGTPNAPSVVAINVNAKIANTNEILYHIILYLFRRYLLIVILFFFKDTVT